MSSSAAAGEDIDLNAAADPQTLAPGKRRRGRPRKNPPQPQPLPPAPVQRLPEHPVYAAPSQEHRKVGGFGPGDMVWGKVRNHPTWPGQVITAGGGSGREGQLLVSYFGDAAFAWCDAAELRPYDAYFTSGERYDGGGEEFAAAVDASLSEFSSRVQAGLTCVCMGAEALSDAAVENSQAHPGVSLASVQSFASQSFIGFVQDLAADPLGFSDRLRLVVEKAHLRVFDRFRGFPDPPEFTVEAGFVNGEVLVAPMVVDVGKKGARDTVWSNSNSLTPSKRMRKRKEDPSEDSDEDWDPRKRGATDSDSDADMERKRGSRRKSSGAPRGRPRGRPRKYGAGRVSHAEKDVEMEAEEVMEYPSAGEMMLQLSIVAADPLKGYDPVPVIVSFFSKYRYSVVPCAYDDKELLETLGSKKGRIKSVGGLYSAIKADDDNDKAQLEMADGKRGRRKSAGSLYSARKAEDSYWCDIIISDFDDGDASSDYDGRKRKRVSQNRSGSNKKMKQESTPSGGSPVDPEEVKPADGPVALVLHFTSAEAIPSEGDINSIFHMYGPIMEGETEITKKLKIAKVVFSKRADAERAYSSTGKCNAFGPALLSYELSYLPSVPQVP